MGEPLKISLHCHLFGNFKGQFSLKFDRLRIWKNELGVKMERNKILEKMSQVAHISTTIVNTNWETVARTFT